MMSRLVLRTIGCCGVVALAVALFGCSVHPLPQDVSYASTVDIVRRIRCEAKEGLDATLEKAASQGAANMKHVETIIDGTTIGFEFKFVIRENNKAEGGQLVFTREGAKPGESFEIILDASLNGAHGPDENTRKNTRIFRVVDDLRELRDARCGRRAMSAGPNLLYPITGSTGMAEVVRTYIELETLTDFAPVKDRRG